LITVPSTRSICGGSSQRHSCVAGFRYSSQAAHADARPAGAEQAAHPLELGRRQRRQAERLELDRSEKRDTGGQRAPGDDGEPSGLATNSILVLASMLEASDDKNVARDTMGKLLSETQGFRTGRRGRTGRLPPFYWAAFVWRVRRRGVDRQRRARMRLMPSRRPCGGKREEGFGIPRCDVDRGVRIVMRPERQVSIPRR